MRSVFDKAAIQSEMPGIILLSHGELALGMLNTSRVLLGNVANIAAFTLEAGDDPAVYRETFVQAVNAFPAGAVILVDMFGGSPCNQLLLGAGELKVPYCAFSGMSLPLVLEAATMRELYIGDALKEAVAAAIAGSIVDIGKAIEELEKEMKTE